MPTPPTPSSRSHPPGARAFTVLGALLCLIVVLLLVGLLLPSLGRTRCGARRLHGERAFLEGGARWAIYTEEQIAADERLQEREFEYGTPWAVVNFRSGAQDHGLIATTGRTTWQRIAITPLCGTGPDEAWTDADARRVREAYYHWLRDESMRGPIAPELKIADVEQTKAMPVGWVKTGIALAALVGAIGLCPAAWRAARRSYAAHEARVHGWHGRRCAGCGYSFEGLARPCVCPECGQPSTPLMTLPPEPASGGAPACP